MNDLKPKQDRADCLACGSSWAWGPEEAQEAPVGTCPRCLSDAVVYTLPGGRRIRFHEGYAVLTIPEEG